MSVAWHFSCKGNRTHPAVRFLYVADFVRGCVGSAIGFADCHLGSICRRYREKAWVAMVSQPPANGFYSLPGRLTLLGTLYRLFNLVAMHFRFTRFNRWKETTTSRVVAAVLLLSMVLAISDCRNRSESRSSQVSDFRASRAPVVVALRPTAGINAAVIPMFKSSLGPISMEFRLLTSWWREWLWRRLKKKTLVSKPSCCQQKVVASCCDKGSSSATCSDQHEASASTEAQADDAPSIRFLSFRAYAKCRGMNWVWTLLNQSTVKVLDPCNEVDLEAPLIAWFQIKDDLLSSDSQAPDPPVPWFAV